MIFLYNGYMLKDIIKTTTFKQSQITIISTIINGGLGALFYIFLARLMGPADFGLLTISLTAMVLVADIADIGTNTGLIRFVASNLLVDKDRAYRFLKLSLEIKLMVWIISCITIFLSAPFLATNIFHKANLLIPLRLVAFGVGGALLFTFATSMLQAFQKYFLWSLVNIMTNFLRLLLIFILAYYSLLSVENSLLVYIILPLFGFFMTLLLIPARKIFSVKSDFNLLKELLRYNLPVAIFTIIAAFSSKLDTFLNASLLSAREVGIYGAVGQLVQIVPQIVAALGLVVAPKFASFTNDKQMVIYLKKLQLFVSGLVIIGILFIPVAIYLIPILFGQAYQDSIFIFILLFSAMLVFLFSVPVHNSVIFYYGRPDVFIWISFCHLILVGGLGYIMIQNFGMIGAAISVLSGTTFNFIYPLVWLFVKLRNNKK